jgi:hypothetical protein
LDKEWIDVVDTAIKIGLGALITGFFTYFSIRLSKKSEMNKFSIEHKTKLLEELAGNIEEYFSYWDLYVAQVSGIARRRSLAEKEDEEITEDQKKDMSARDKELIAAWSLREKAVAKLRLINAGAAAKELVACKKLEKEIRDPIVFEKTFPSYDEVESYRKKSKAQKLKVHECLAKFYEYIHT